LTRTGKGPQRTCIACRQSKDQAQLVRYVVAPDGELLVDYRHRLPGRGAYTCIDIACLQTAVERKLFQRSFRGNCREISSATLIDGLIAALRQRIANLLGMAKKSGQYVSGSSAVMSALRHNSGLALVLISEDISSGIAVKVKELSARHGVPCVSMFSKDGLGQLFGKGERSVVAIETGSLADILLIELQRYLQLVREN